MPRHMGFQAWIQLGLAPLFEYAPSIEGNTVSCFIPGFAGKSFSVHWKDEGTQVHSAGYVICDGVAVPGRYLGGMGETFRSGVRSGPTSERRFTFADIPKNAPGPSATSALGSIELKIMQVKHELGGRPNNAPQWGVFFAGNQLVSTDAEHQATLGAQDKPYNDQIHLSLSLNPINGERTRSYVKFIFYYRPFQWLRDHGLMAHNPIPPPQSIFPRQMIQQPYNFTVYAAPFPGISSGDVYQIEDEDERKYFQLYLALQATYQTTSSVDPDVDMESRRAGKQRVPNELGVRHASNTAAPRAAEDPRAKAKADKRAEESAAREHTEEMEVDKPKARRSPRKRTKKEQKARECEPPKADGPPDRGTSKADGPPDLETSKADGLPDRELTIEELREKYKVPFEEEMARRAAADAQRKASMTKARELPQPAQIQQHPHASNTYILPSASGSGPNYPYPPYPILGRTPSSRPSAIIDTRVFGYATPSPSVSSSTAGSSSSGSGYAQRAGYPANWPGHSNTGPGA